MKVKTHIWLRLTATALLLIGLVPASSAPARAAGPWYVAPGGSDGFSHPPCLRCSCL